MRQRVNEIEFKEEEVDELSGKKKKEEKRTINRNKLNKKDHLLLLTCLDEMGE